MATWTQIGDTNRWRIRVDCGTDGNGKRIRKSFIYTATATTPKKLEHELQRVADAFRKQCIEALASPASYVTVQNLIDWWQNSRDVTASEVDFSDAVFDKYLSHLYDKSVVDLTVADIQSIVDKMSLTVQESSVRRYFTPVRSLLRYAYRMELIDNPIADRVTLPRSSRSSRANFWNADQLKTFLRCFDRQLFYRNGKRILITMPWKVFFVLAVYTGARRGELLALCWSSFSPRNHTVSITSALASSKNGQYVKEPKTASGIRTISLPDNVFALLTDYRAHQQASGYSVLDSDFIFQQEDGRPLNLSTPTHKFAELVDLFNVNLAAEKQLPTITLHGLRHSAASLMVASGVDILTVARRLGHSKASVTLDIYSHADESKDEEATEVFSSLLT